MMKKAFVGVKSYYYKKNAANAVLDHAHYLRNGFTVSANVHPKYTKNNISYYFHHARSCADALKKMCEKHKEVTRKKVRSDNNVLFEHVLWLSEHRYTQLEKKHGEKRVKKAVIQKLKQYALSIQNEFGFTPLGIDFHLDEGHFENDIFVRNIHAHVQFMNYDFDKRIAPLRHLMKKGKNVTGRTNHLNPHFEKMQDLAHTPFKNLGFNRGISKNITSKEHLSKEAFVKNKIITLEENIAKLENKNSKLSNSNAQLQQKNEKLEQTVDIKKKEYSVIKNKILSLQKLQQELTTAIKKNCKIAIQKINKHIFKSSNTQKLKHHRRF